MKALPLIALVVLGAIVALAYPATSEQITVTAEVPTYVSVVFNYNAVSFGTVQPGTIDYPAPGNSQGLYNVTVSSNVNLNVSIHRTAWTPNDVLTLKFAHALSPAGLTPGVAFEVTIDGTTYSFSEIGEFQEFHGYWLSVPSTAPAGSYSTTVTITYTP